MSGEAEYVGVTDVAGEAGRHYGIVKKAFHGSYGKDDEEKFKLELRGKRGELQRLMVVGENSTVVAFGQWKKGELEAFIMKDDGKDTNYLWLGNEFLNHIHDFARNNEKTKGETRLEANKI